MAIRLAPQSKLPSGMNQSESASLARLVAPVEATENQTESSETHESNDSVWSKLSRETYVVGGGLLDGIAGNAREAVADPSKVLPELGAAVGIGAVMALAHGRKGIIGLGAKIVGLSFGVGFIKDLTSEERLTGIGNAVSDTWKSSAHLEENRDAINHHAGQFAFDTAVMMAGGTLGAGAMRYHGRTSELPMFKEIFKERTPSLSGSLGLSTAELAAKRHLPSMEVTPGGPMAPSKFAHLLETNIKPAGAKAPEVIEFPAPNGTSTLSWKPASESVRVRLEAQSFVEKLQRGDYMGALNVAVNSPGLSGVELNPATRKTSLTIKASEVAKNSNEVALLMDQMSSLGKFEWSQSSTSSSIGLQKLVAVVPQVNVELRPGTTVPLVEFVRSESGFKAQTPAATTSGAKLSASDMAEINTLRQSPAGQRLIAETAIIAFEESTVHANQHMGGGIMSPTFAEFSKQITVGSEYKTRSHLLAFIGMLSRQDQHRAIVFEQEVPALLYDAGMPLSMIKHHYFFGSRHVQERTPIMQFLEQREAP